MGEALAAADLDTCRGRIAAIGRVAEALLASGISDHVFVGSALLAWLQTDRGKLERDFFRVLAPRSRHTVARIWRELNSDAHQPRGEGN